MGGVEWGAKRWQVVEGGGGVEAVQGRSGTLMETGLALRQRLRRPLVVGVAIGVGLTRSCGRKPPRSRQPPHPAHPTPRKGTDDRRESIFWRPTSLVAQLPPPLAFRKGRREGWVVRDRVTRQSLPSPGEAGWRAGAAATSEPRGTRSHPRSLSQARCVWK